MGDIEDIETAETAFAGATPDAPAGVRSRLPAGTAVGGYVIEEYCGGGGMGEVYRARDRLLSRDVAIKVVSAAGGGAGRCGVLCSLLVREAQTLAKLSHPSLVSVFSVGEHERCVYVAMEYVDGTTLSRWSARRSWRACLDALLDAARGLSAAHSAGVIHRDFKPDNVMVTRDGVVKVMDFGLARSSADVEDAPRIGACASCAPEDQVAQIRDPGAVVGTPRYMAPELFEGGAADTRSDQYSFAVSCWEVLYRALPFRGETPAQLYFSKKGHQPAGATDSDVPAEVERVLRRALLPSASRRYPSLEDLTERISRAAES